MTRWLAVPMSLLFGIPAVAFDDAAFCQRLTDFAAKANADKPDAPDPLTSNDAMVVDCDRKTVQFNKSVALSYSELGEMWHVIKQREWNSAHCGNVEWAPIFARGWKVSMTVTTFDGKRVTFFAQCE